MAPAKPIAVVLLSGGLDSATTAAICQERGFDIAALSFRYGQRHDLELDAARRVAKALAIRKHVEMAIDLRAFGGSALTDDIDVPKGRTAESMDAGIPITYVPARNTIFLAFALAYAETLGSSDIFIGVNAVDYAGYPDCRIEFIEAFERMAQLGTKAGADGRAIRVHVPLIAMSKADIVREGVRLKVDFSLTHSCYDPTADGLACGQCDSCLLRLRGFADAGRSDPLPYARQP